MSTIKDTSNIRIKVVRDKEGNEKIYEQINDKWQEMKL